FLNFGVLFFSNTKLLIFGNFYFIIGKSLNSFNVKRNFVFINIQNIVKGINNEGVSHLKRMELYRNKDLYFYEEASKNIIFRDATSEIKLFCTQELESILNELDIKGLALEKVGKVAPIPSFSKEKNIFNR
ncbi:hypothetical protein C8P65_11933, partial [Capnocytophaga leadbetteri]